MTPAELKTLRESLGLTLNWLSEQSGISLRSVQYWESGETAVPENVVNFMNAIEAEFEKCVRQAIEAVMDFMQTNGGPPECTDMIRYRTDADFWHYRPDMRPMPTTYHAAMVQRTRRELFKIGVTSRIIYMSPEDYELWLEEEELADNEGARTLWAAMQDR